MIVLFGSPGEDSKGESVSKGTAYLLVRLNTNVFPPFVDRVRITSQPAGSMCDGLWAEIMHVDAEDFSAASKLLENSIHSKLGHVLPRWAGISKFLSVLKTGESDSLNRLLNAVEAAINLVNILRKD
jgi:hypothetical protein